MTDETPTSRFHLDGHDATAAVGLGLVFVGVAMIHVPAALIVLGVSIIGVALRGVAR